MKYYSGTGTWRSPRRLKLSAIPRARGEPSALTRISRRSKLGKMTGICEAAIERTGGNWPAPGSP